MSQEHSAPGQEPLQHTRRPIAEPGHRYSPRHIRSRPVAVAHPAVTAVPTRNTNQAGLKPKLIDSIQPARKPKTVQALKPAMPRQHRSRVLKRHFIENATQFSVKNKQQRTIQAKAFVFGGIATMAIIGGVLAVSGLGFYKSSDNSNAKVATLGASTDLGGAPDESPITIGAMNDYTVPADKPRLLRIPRLQLVTRVLAVDTNIKDLPIAPTNIFDTGWLKSSTNPGEIGGALLIGSVVGPTKAGIFARLIDLVPGDELQIERGDGSTQKFKVVKSQSYAANGVDMTAATKSAVAGKPGLNLLTATGRFNVKTNQFENSTVVFAVQD